MAKEKILVVEDEEDIQELIRYNLGKEGYHVLIAGSGEDGVKLGRKDHPDLVLLDIMLPGIDGLQVCRQFKQDERTRDIPILMITAKGEEADIVTGLELGAEDYITKPFSPRILIARIRNVLRRRSQEALGDEESVIKHHDLVIHPGRHEASIKGKKLDLTFTEFRVLQFLARRPGWVYTRQQIVDAVRGEDYPVTDRSVDVQIVGLRRKLGAYGKYIETVRGVGYRFQE